MNKEKRVYGEARLQVVRLNGSMQLLAGSDGGASGGGNSGNTPAPLYSASLHEMGTGTLQ